MIRIQLQFLKIATNQIDNRGKKLKIQELSEEIKILC